MEPQQQQHLPAGIARFLQNYTTNRPLTDAIKQMHKSSPHNTPSSQYVKKDSNSSNLSVDSGKFVRHNLHDFERDYEVKEKLGQGEYGGIFKVTHRLLGIDRALKIISKAVRARQPIPKEEIDSLIKLDHPNIIKIYEFYQSKDLYYIVIEYFQGRELFDELCEEDVFNQVKAARVSSQILKALHYTHQKNVVHRDIKAENIMIKSQDNRSWIKIIDWGLGTTGMHNGLDMTIGTPQYIAPEVITGKYDQKCDVWGFGVILHTMLCGVMPFMGATQKETLQLVRKKKIVFDTKEWKNISKEGKDLVSQLLERNPKLRPSAEQALKHPWFSKLMKTNTQPVELKSTLHRLKELQLENHLQTATYSYIHNHLTCGEQKRQLDQIFLFLDTNHNGTLQFDELLKGYKTLYGNAVGALVAEEVFRKLDYNHSGTIEYSEFITYAMLKHKEVPKSKLQEAFKLFDTNRDGNISTEELRRILSNGIEDVRQEEWDGILKAIDTNNDGEINKEEFFHCMTKISELCATVLSKSRCEDSQCTPKRPSCIKPTFPRRSLRNRKSPNHLENIPEVVQMQASQELQRLI